MSSYTCNSCALAFRTGEDQRTHMKSNWHCYNLKRRVAQLPPIDEASFNEKFSRLSFNRDAKVFDKEKEALLERKKALFRLKRNKMVKTMQEFDISSDSTGMSEEGQKTDDQVDEELLKLKEVEQMENIIKEKIKNKVEIPLESCIFCAKRSFPTFEKNLDHMFKSHGFYIPEQKYLVDKVGLVQYLSEKVWLGNFCLCCSYQGRSLEAVRAHMSVKAHCRIPYESEDEKLEISKFYDFTSSYAALDASAAANEDDWKDIESEEEDAFDFEDEVPPQDVYQDGIELHLPNGVKLGHRSMQRYYRQNIKPERELTESQGTVIAAETRHFATVFDMQTAATQKRVWRSHIKDKKRDDKRAAKFINNQPHYRDQLLQ